MKRFGTAILIALALAALTARPVSAHAFLTSSSPGDGQVVDTAPTQLRLSFSELVVISGMSVQVAATTGHLVPTGPPHLLASPGADNAGPEEAGAPQDTEDPVTVVVDIVEPLTRGTYRVTWATSSADDLHRTTGVFAFGFQATVVAAGWSETGPSLSGSLLRWLVLLGIAAGIGSAVATGVLRRGAPGLDRRRMDRTAMGLVGIAVFSTVPLLLLELAGSGRTLADLAASGYGARWAVRSVGLLLLGIAAARRLRSRDPDPSTRLTGTPLAVLGALLAALGTGLLGHSGTGGTGSGTGALVAALHVVAASSWVGSLAMVATALLRRDATGADWSRTLRAFGPPALAATAVMVVTGVLLASRVAGSVDAVLLTDYGRTLLLKLALVGVAGAVGLSTRRRLSVPNGGVRALVLVEVGAGVAVVLATAVLTSGQPALEPELVGRQLTPSSTAYGQIADLGESIALRPNRPGDNVLLLQVDSSRRPSPGAVTAVTVSVAGGAPATALPVPGGQPDRWSAPLRLGSAGPTTLRVTVVRAGLPDRTVPFRWVTGSASAEPAAVISRVPLRMPLTWVGVALGLVIAGACAGAARRRRTGRELELVEPDTRAAPGTADLPLTRTLGV